jgi:hypothetical protein
LSILTAWICQQKLLGPDDLRPMVRTLEGNLRKASGSPGLTASCDRSPR